MSTHGESFDAGALRRLRERGLELSKPSNPAGKYVTHKLHRGTGYLAAQLPSRDGQYVMLGRVGAELDLEAGRRAAELAALSAITRIRSALGTLDRLETLLRVDGIVASAQGFYDQPKVLDGASELFVAVLAERGEHARSAVATPWLPGNNSVELVITFAYRE